MAKAKATTPKKEYAHVFDGSCMNYYGTFEGASREELLSQIEQDLRENDEPLEDFVVVFGPLYQLRTKGIELVMPDAPDESIDGVNVR